MHKRMKNILGSLIFTLASCSWGQQPMIQRLSDLCDSSPMPNPWLQEKNLPPTLEPWQDLSHRVVDELKGALEKIMEKGTTFQLDLQQELRGPASLKIDRIENIRLNADKSRVTAVVFFRDSSYKPLSLSAKVALTMLVPVPNRVIMPLECLQASDFTFTELPLGRFNTQGIVNIHHLIGKQARVPLKPGVPVKGTDIQSVQTVQRGKPVRMQVVTPWIQLQAQGTALDSGGEGDIIRVMNVDSQKVMQARIIAPQLVEIESSLSAMPASKTSHGRRKA